MQRKVDIKMIDEYIKNFDNNEKLKEKTLNDLFREKYTNKKLQDVLIKVCTLDALYATRIRKADLTKIAEHIIDLENIDGLLDDGNIEAINQIGTTPKEVNNAYSFASKYCSFHNPDKFIIIDQWSWKALVKIANEYHLNTKLAKEWNSKYDSYLKYCDCLNEFLSKLSKKYTYKDIDKFLWLYGKNDNRI
ncbi:MAG: hypothetical protein E7282_06460 [Lachnospiraceae bacterium]|nr:hypothetical protein [Lachnospiraceae bacterium]